MLAVTTGGCVTLPLSALGTLAGITSSAVSSGHDIFKLGKLDAAEMASPEEAFTAAHAAATDLALKLRRSPPDADHISELVFDDDLESPLTVRVERRTQRLVRIRVDVGLFGSEVTARLFLSRMRAHLSPRANEIPQPGD